MSTTTRRLTADEFFLLPRQEPGMSQELLRGKIRTKPVPGREHGMVAMEVGRLLANHVKTSRLGEVYAAETGFVIARNPDTVQCPDASFVRRERVAEIIDRVKFLPFAPDLAVEVASPGDRPAEIARKTARWIAAGTRMVWDLYPKTRTVTVDRPGQGQRSLAAEDSLEGDEVIPGFTCRVGELFE